MGRTKEKSKNVSQAEILKLPYLVLAVSILFTIGATYIFYRNEKSKDFVRFQNGTDRCKNGIDNKMRAYVGLLKAGRGFVEANENLDRKKFAGFVNSLEIKQNFPEVSQMGFAKKTLPSESEELIKQMQAQGYNNFKIFPPSENESQPIIYIEPHNDWNISQIGFDMLSNPLYRTAMNQAYLTGEATAIGKVSLDWKNEEKLTGFMIFMPVYQDQDGEIPQTIEDRKKLLAGFIYNIINADMFLKDALKNAGVSGITVAFYDKEMNPENLIARTDKNFQFDSQGLNLMNEASLAGKKWIIGYQTLPDFDIQSRIGWTPGIFIMGSIFSLMLFGITYLESNARAKAENISAELQESEKEKGFLLEREQKARQSAEESNRVKDEFISIVSHELRTPLNSIAGWSRILKSEKLSETTKQKALQTIEKNVRVQTEIVEDLLNLSQIVSGSQSFTKQKLNISEIFEEVFLEAKESAKKKNISLVKENNLGSEIIIGDGAQLKRVFKNLFSNALKFTSASGKIFTDLSKKDDWIEIKIADTGQGIRPEVLSGIFENFSQADSSITRSHGGLGLGLALVRRIVELHGGEISANSEGEGKGTEFTIRLPTS